jgi:predicted nucleic acid-binding protein
MILVDTSVVIDWSQGRDANLRVLLPSLPVAVCGVTQAEVLHGSRDRAHRQQLLADLATFQFLPMPDALWITVGDNLAALRRNGITVPLADAVIATLGIENDIEVWARDPHFPAMHIVLPRLKLFQEPP